MTLSKAPRVLSISVLLAIASPGASRAQEIEQDFFLSDGVRIHYTVEGAGTPVVLLHGFAVDSELNWRTPGVLPALSRSFRVIAPDLRGHGRSEKSHDPSAYGGKMVEDVLNLLDHLAIERAHIVGYSMGSTLALNLAVNHPDRILSLVLGGSGWIRPETQWVEDLRRRSEALEDLAPGQSITGVLFPPGAPEPPPDVRAQMQAKLEANDPRALAAVSRQLPELWISEAALRSSRVPTLALIGEQDELHSTVEAMIGVKPSLEVKVLPERDHISALMDPEFVPAIRQFLLSGVVDALGKPAPPVESAVVADSVQPDSAVEAVVGAWVSAYERGDAEALAETFTEDGMYAANTGQLLRGRAGIRHGAAGWFAGKSATFTRLGLSEKAAVDLNSELLRIRTAGKVAAYALGRFIIRAVPPGCVLDSGHWLAVWRRQASGEWRIESLVVNKDQELPQDHCARR